jgi:hypothetical protein
VQQLRLERWRQQERFQALHRISPELRGDEYPACHLRKIARIPTTTPRIDDRFKNGDRVARPDPFA